MFCGFFERGYCLGVRRQWFSGNLGDVSRAIVQFRDFSVLLELRSFRQCMGIFLQDCLRVLHLDQVRQGK